MEYQKPEEKFSAKICMKLNEAGGACGGINEWSQIRPAVCVCVCVCVHVCVCVCLEGEVGRALLFEISVL